MKENDGELNKSVSVQGMPPCMTLLQEMRGEEEEEEEEEVGVAHTEEKERGGASQDAATRFGAQSRMRR